MNEFDVIDTGMTEDFIESVNKDIEKSKEYAQIEREEYQRAYRRNHRQEMIEARKRYYRRNKDKLRAYQREYRLKHAHDIKRYQAEYRQARREKK